MVTDIKIKIVSRPNIQIQSYEMNWSRTGMYKVADRSTR